MNIMQDKTPHNELGERHGLRIIHWSDGTLAYKAWYYNIRPIGYSAWYQLNHKLDEHRYYAR